MAFLPTTPNIHSRSSSTRLASTNFQESRPAITPPENRLLLHEISFNTGSRKASDQHLAPLPLVELHTFGPALPKTIPVDCDSSIETTTDYPYRHKSPFHAYLSPGYSSAQSPSLASDGMLEYSQDSNKVWMMTPTRDIDGSTPQNTSTLVSSGGTARINGAFIDSYDPSLLEGTPPTWPAHQQRNYHTTQMNLRRMTATEHATDNSAGNMLPEHHPPAPTPYLFGHGYQEDPYAYDSGPSLTDVSTPVGISYGQPNSTCNNSMPTSQNAEVETVMGNSARPEQFAPEMDGQGSHTMPQGDRKTQICKSCRKTISDLAEQDEHDRNCEGLPCLFFFAGCRARCKGKNEWKRHLKTQHLLSTLYICVACDSKEFNRKDLFKQHYLRMHCTPAERESHKDKKTSSAFSKRLNDEHAKAFRGECPPPPRADKCFMLGCATTFLDNDSWDKCLEHVAKHYEAVMKDKEAARPFDFTTEQLQYFVEVKALIHKQNGTWVLGAQSSGERARKNKKKTAKRSADIEQEGSTTRGKRARKTQSK